MVLFFIKYARLNKNSTLKVVVGWKRGREWVSFSAKMAAFCGRFEDKGVVEDGGGSWPQSGLTSESSE